MLTNAIFQGRRYRVVGRIVTGVWIERLTATLDAVRRYVSESDVDLILDPTDEELALADAFERGDIEAFEYPDGHTFPSGPHEIRSPRRPFNGD